jgi:protein-S-isoprenylcysteine O-methyltransferase Ste14
LRASKDGESRKQTSNLILGLPEDKMHLMDQRILGIAILCLLGMLVTVKRTASGSVLDKPVGSFMIQLVNVFNLFFLLIVNPAAAVMLIFRRLEAIDPTRIVIDLPSALFTLELAGLVFYVMGFLLMAWALLGLGRNYQLAGTAPRDTDAMIMAGPYSLIRHPMYAAALSISFGLACLIQSFAFFTVFCIYLVLILHLVPLEEEGLQQAYGEKYAAYKQSTSKLIPFVY